MTLMTHWHLQLYRLCSQCKKRYKNYFYNCQLYLEKRRPSLVISKWPRNSCNIPVLMLLSLFEHSDQSDTLLNELWLLLSTLHVSASVWNKSSCKTHGAGETASAEPKWESLEHITVLKNCFEDKMREKKRHNKWQRSFSSSTPQFLSFSVNFSQFIVNLSYYVTLRKQQ